jgi:hypothetical protein
MNSSTCMGVFGEDDGFLDGGELGLSDFGWWNFG